MLGVSGHFHFIQRDLLNREETVEVFKQISPHVVVHLAALPGVAYSIEDLLHMLIMILKQRLMCLRLRVRRCVSKVVFASSSSVYGNQAGPI